MLCYSCPSHPTITSLFAQLGDPFLQWEPAGKQRQHLAQKPCVLDTQDTWEYLLPTQSLQADELLRLTDSSLSPAFSSFFFFLAFKATQIKGSVMLFGFHLQISYSSIMFLLLSIFLPPLPFSFLPYPT